MRSVVVPHLSNFFAVERVSTKDLRELARREKKQFAGSTSSMSGMLSHIYFLLSGFKDADLSIMSQEFAHEASLFFFGLSQHANYCSHSLLRSRVAKKCPHLSC